MTEFYQKEGDEFKKVDSFTEEQIDEIAGDVPWLTTRLERARESERKKFEGFDEIKTKATDLETQLTAANTKIEDLTKTVGAKDLEVEKVKITHEFKLSDDLAEFVTGDSAEEMRKRAEKLANGVKPSNVHIDKKDKPEKKTTDTARIAGELFGRKKV